MKRNVTKEEVHAAESDLERWMSAVRTTDSALSSSQKHSKVLVGGSSGKKNLPAVRGSVPTTIKDSDATKISKKADLRIEEFYFAREVITKNQISKLVGLREDLQASDLSELQRKHRAS